VRDSGSRLRDNEVAVKAHARSALCRNQRPPAALPAPPAPPHRVRAAVATRYCKPSIQLSPIGGKGDCLLSLRERIEVRDSGSRLRDNEVAVKAHARSALCRNQRPLAALPAPPAPPHRVRAAVRPTKPAAPCGSGFNPTVLTFIAVLCRAAVRPTKPALSVGRVLTRRF